MTGVLSNYLEVWNSKPVLRLVYADFFDRIFRRCGPGPTLEIGSGIGNLKSRLADVWASDIQFAPWLDLVLDAQKLPFHDQSLGNIVMLDALHHIEFPINFFRDAARVLRPGGRIIMIEPAITWGSACFYRFFHHEPVVMSADPLIEGDARAGRDPYDSNQAIPTLIATRFRDRFHRVMPELNIKEVPWFSFLVYPLSGGFKRWSLIPASCAPALLRFERTLEGFWGRALGFRMLIVIEKRRSAA